MTSESGTKQTQAARGLLSTGSSQIGQMVLQLVSVAVLARLLTPQDFGLVAMVMIVIGVADLFRDLGLSNAAIAARELSLGMRSNLFWANTGMGALLALAVAAFAPAIAALYGRPELTAITWGLAPMFLLSGLATQFRVHLVRSLRFSALAGISLVAPLLSLGIAIPLALAGAGPWAIVAQSLAGAAINLVLLVLIARWLPGRLERATGLRHMLRLGGAFFASSLLTYVKQNADSFIIGYQFGADRLGLYNRSVQTIRTPIRQLQQPFGAVVVPVAARQQDDKHALMATLRDFAAPMTYGISAVAAIAAGAPRDLIAVVLGSQWLDAAPVLMCVALSAAVAAAAGPVSWVYTSLGLAGALLRYTTLTTVITLVLIVAGAQFGFVGAAVGYLLSTMVSYPLTFARVGRLSGLPTARFALDCARPLLLMALVVGASHGLLTIWDVPQPFGLIVALAMLLVVSLLAAALPAVRGDYRRIRSTISRMAG